MNSFICRHLKGAYVKLAIYLLALGMLGFMALSIVFVAGYAMYNFIKSFRRSSDEIELNQE